MKELMEVWRRKVLEPHEREMERERELTVDVDATEDEFEVGDKVQIQVVDDEVEEEEGIEEEKKKVKKNCHDYNPYHSADDGKFVDPDKEKGSYSMAQGSGDCTWGKSSRKSANRSRQAVKQPCGRGAKYRCKDGSAKWESLNNEGIEQQDAAYIRGIISTELKRALQAQMKKTGCGYADIVRAINMIAAAEKGELFGKKDK